MIILLLFIIISSVVYISINNQKKDLLEAAKKTLAINMDILNITIKSIMLSGEAPIAVNSIKGYKEITEFKEAEIYRTTGDVAFVDFRTLDFVNQYQDKIMFEKTNRVNRKILDNENFQFVLKRNIPINQEIIKSKEMEYFFPIRNEGQCWECHGKPVDTGSIRGIAHFKISIAGIYKQIQDSAQILILLFIITGISLALFLIVLMRNLIIKPLLIIGNKVKQFGAGNYDIKLNIESDDELGVLADKINEMFTSTKERINLSKYVSKSTDEMIKKGTLQKTGEKKYQTVLFSDIRGFTKYSENNKPDIVIDNLNSILETQSKIVEKFKGDIDKYIGDSIMAIFDNEYDAVKCGYELIMNIIKLTKRKNTSLFIGVGINSGEVITGNIGSENRLEYAVIGDTVNVASRLCSIAKPNMMLISESVYDKVKDKVKAKIVKNQNIKGKSRSLNFYIVQSIS